MRNMRKPQVLVALLVLAAVPLAMTVTHAASGDRSYTVNNLTTQSTAKSVPAGGSPVSCGANTTLRVKCSQGSEWQLAPQGGNLTVACSSGDPSLQYAPGQDTDNYSSVSWACATGQNVSISGVLTNCDDVSLSHTTSCQ